MSEFIDTITETAPDPSLTVTSKQDAVSRIMKAVESGDSEITLDIVCSENDAESYVKDIDPFFGAPNAYRVESTFDDIVIEEGKPPVFVSRVRYQLAQSTNWYALKLLDDPANPIEVPADKSAAASELAKKLP
ncbi:MAG: hypothetical protein LBN36_01775, partial [Clostridiales Family XIII bacterium]|nr:hypothetical protein [Clostridiales Family XIII bacterium]